MKTASIQPCVRPVHFRRHLAATVLAAGLMTAFTGARAQSSVSEASVLSTLPIAVSVAAPVMLLSAGVALTVVAVEASTIGTVWVLERASDGARSSVRLGAHAGRSCDTKPMNVATIQRAMLLAGQNLSEYGVHYSHLGIAYRDGARWRIVHKLNQCGTAQASIYRQGLGEFFLDDLYEYEAAFVMPLPDVQARLLPALRDNARLEQLHNPSYSMVAYPWALTYQQSNQWAIKTLAMTQDVEGAAAAARPPYTRTQAQAWLRQQGYEPTTLKISALKRLGARATAANVAFDDHPNEKRFTDRIETVTVDSVFAWLNRDGLGGPVQVIR